MRIPHDTDCLNRDFDASAAISNHIVIDTAAHEATFFGWGRALGPTHLLKTPSRKEDLP